MMRPMRDLVTEPRMLRSPSPRWGEGWGEGVRAYREVLPPLPMGEGAGSIRRTALRILIALFVFAVAAPASAQPAAEFYKGKQIRIVVGSTAGGDYDVWARLLARHWPRHIPGNPSFIVENMPGAGTLVATNHLYNVAPKDGTVIATASRAAPFAPLLGAAGGTSFDASKFTWIGSANNEVSTCVAWGSTGITSLGQLRETELIIGGTARAPTASSSRG